MKLFFSPASPFVRKVTITAAELGLSLENVSSAAGPVERNQSIIPANALGQVPTLITDDGMALYDSPVICEYLDSIAGGGKIFPAAGPARWTALVEQALGDGLTGAALLARYETALRPADKQWTGWYDGQMDKVRTACDAALAKVPGFGDRMDIGTISIACGLGYLDYRFPNYGWREGREALAAWYDAFSARPSVKASAPPV